MKLNLMMASEYVFSMTALKLAGGRRGVRSGSTLIRLFAEIFGEGQRRRAVPGPKYSRKHHAATRGKWSFAS